MTDPLLQAKSVSKSFGGIQAVKEVSLSLGDKGVHAVIGPNGAGKTTLLNVLSGELKLSAGSLMFQGQDISRKPMHQRARLGLGRSYQRTNVFQEFSVLETLRLAAQSASGQSWTFWRKAKSDQTVELRAERAMVQAGLEARRDRPAKALSHGERRALEVAAVLALDPALLLLDEPLAGMGPGESEGVVALIQEIARTRSVALIEHDMDAVFALADEITVMVEGAVIACGQPDAIRQDEAVRAAYLGEDDGP